jgi:hypothetical protein
MATRSNKRKIIASNWKLFGGLTESALSIGKVDQTNTSYTLQLTDNGQIIYANNASANTITIPPNSSVEFPIGAKMDVVQTGAGQTTFVVGSGVTVNSEGLRFSINAQYQAVSLIKTDTNTWVLIGALA